MSIDGISFAGGINTKIDSKDKNNKADTSFDSILNMSMNKKNESNASDSIEGVYVHEIGRTDTRQYAKRNPELNDRFKNHNHSFKIDKKVDNIQDKEISVEDIEDKAALFQNVKMQIIDNLGISEEELEESLDALNLEIGDLINPENLKNVIMNINNANETDVLLNEGLDLLINNTIEDVNTLVNNFSNGIENKISETDELLTQTTIVDNLDSEEPISNAVEDFTVEEVVADDTKSVLDTKNDTVKIDTEENDSNININQSTDKNDDIKVTVETETSAFDNKNKGTDSKTDASQIINNLNNALNNVSNENVIPEINNFADSIQEFDIIRQIIDEIRVNMSKDTTSMEMQLNPENLGKVHISVVEKDGIMQAQITTENEAAKHAIETNLMLLKDNFQNQELKVEAIEVMVASYEFFNQNETSENTENNEMANSNRQTRINASDDISVDDLNDREQLEVKMMRENGNSISYLA